MRTFRFCLAVTMGLAWLSPAAAGPRLRTVALTGDDAPGTEAGVSYAHLNTPRIDASGRVTFSARLSDTVAAADSGIWSEGGGSLSLVAREGSPAPDEPGLFSSLHIASPLIGSSGNVAFKGSTSSGGGIWSEQSGSLQPVVRQGDDAPGAGSGVQFLTPNYPAHTAAGTAFLSSLTAGSGKGIWSHTGGSLQPVARTGTEAPGTGGHSFDTMNNPVMNGSGHTVFRGELSGVGVHSGNDEGIWSNRSGSLQLVAREGSVAPGGGTVGHVGQPTINNNGEIAFRSSSLGIWSEGGGPLHLVAGTGSTAPGTGDKRFSAFNGPMLLNGAGKVAFTASLTGSGVTSANNSGVWSELGGYLSLVAREGSDAPGIPGSVLDDFTNSAFAVNRNGLLVFRTGVVGSYDRAIWWADPSGTVQLLFRVGDLMEVLPGDLRTISSIGFPSVNTGGEDGEPRVLNDTNELALWASFTDSSHGIFVVTIPEPATLSLLALGGLALLRRRR